MDFGPEISGGESAPQTFTVSNVGDGPLHVSEIQVGDTATLGGEAEVAAYEIDEDGCTGTTVPAGGTCQVKVTFDPTATGEQSGYVLVKSDGGKPFGVLAGEGTL